jgi:hypothetical protein
MIKAHDPAATPVATDLDPATIFETDWQIYRTLVDNNLLFHQEVSNVLVREIIARFSAGFRFLDLACGDADVMSRALRKTTVKNYLGVDLSPQALEIATKNLEDAPIDARLEQIDILTTLSENPGTYDVIWCGLCLHHFQSSEEKTPGFLSHPLCAELQRRVLLLRTCSAGGQISRSLQPAKQTTIPERLVAATHRGTV